MQRPRATSKREREVSGAALGANASEEELLMSTTRGIGAFALALATLLSVRALPEPSLRPDSASHCRVSRRRWRAPSRKAASSSSPRRRRPPASAPSSMREAARHATPSPSPPALARVPRSSPSGSARRSRASPSNPLLNLGGPSLQRRSVAKGLEACRLAGEVVPREANAVGRRQPSPLFGLGLVQAIPSRPSQRGRTRTTVTGTASRVGRTSATASSGASAGRPRSPRWPTSWG